MEPTTGEYTRVRKSDRRREDDKFWDRLIATVMRWRGLAALLWGLGGGTITWIAYRAFTLDKIEGQSIRITAVELNQLLLGKSVDTVRSDIRAMLKKACLETSLADQEIAEMRCPANLYKGAPR